MVRKRKPTKGAALPAAKGDEGQPTVKTQRARSVSPCAPSLSRRTGTALERRRSTGQLRPQHGPEPAPFKFFGTTHGHKKTKFFATLAPMVAVVALLSAVFYGADVDADELAVTAKVLTDKTLKEADTIVTELKDFYYTNTAHFTGQDQARPGLEAAALGMRVKHPVVFVPGLVTTGLEMWKGLRCSDGSEAIGELRARIWGGTGIIKKLLVDRDCWLSHIQLDMHTGLDPPGIKLRPAHGLEAGDFFLPGYWVWGKVIANLADIGYDVNSMFMASYDWRLSLLDLERRDHYFTKLKSTIEVAVVSNNNEKVVVIAHSLGASVFHYFMQWVEAENEGWVDRHVRTFVNIGGALLGTPKAVASMISGEMRDTADLNEMQQYLFDTLITMERRMETLRSWSSVSHLLPKGGEAVWGGDSGAPDDTEGIPTFGVQVQIQDEEGLVTEPFQESMTIDNIEPILMHLNSTIFGRTYSQNSYGNARGISQINRGSDQAKWTNPLESALPNSPGMNIYCFYGVNKGTERAYRYRPNQDETTNTTIPYTIDKSQTMKINPDIEIPQWSRGVGISDGDGTVPLVSLGYMCRGAWKGKKHNPAQLDVITREFKHNPVSGLKDLRGGRDSGDHVDIMGNHGLLEDILAIASGQGHKLKDRIVSNIDQISERISGRLEE